MSRSGMNSLPPIVFFGSGPVAVQSLKFLSTICEIEAVVTKSSTEMMMQAITPNTPVHCANNKEQVEDVISAHNFRSRLGILIDFGVIITRQAIDSFEKGIINSHFSLLPEWRGADPIVYSILSGQAQTGVSLMLLADGMDTGQLLTQSKIPISGTVTTPELTDQLIKLSNSCLTSTIPDWLSGNITPKPQDHDYMTTYSAKSSKDDRVLDFNKPAAMLEREIRAYYEWPKSKTSLAKREVIITKAHVDNSHHEEIGATYITADKQIGISTRVGALIIDELKPVGKNAMSAQAFLAGYKL